MLVTASTASNPDSADAPWARPAREPRRESPNMRLLALPAPSQTVASSVFLQGLPVLSTFLILFRLYIFPSLLKALVRVTSGLRHSAETIPSPTVYRLRTWRNSIVFVVYWCSGGARVVIVKLPSTIFTGVASGIIQTTLTT
ncbi:uncharacterized protein RCO7_05527 [Rhynchosporium graminicola]|uniref:Uncharacterized protein n=1 Tax=Rhynchosporium graminicola TaxID=2792576 RepID=A0A1E1L2B6_9HELO|nr:uncharacterized protein RCO7_05527 [Rhynchosporium commune]